MNFQRFIDQHHAVYSEVIRGDTYRLTSLDFTPDTVIDLGANVGCFTAFAKSLWPHCKVVAVEPHPKTFALLTEYVGHLSGVTLTQAAIGRGLAFFRPSQTQLGCIGYQSEHIGFTRAAMESNPKFVSAPEIPTVLLPDLMPDNPGRFVIKIDCEGGEGAILDDVASTEIMHQADYWAAEIHFYQMAWENPPRGTAITERYMATHGTLIRRYLEWIYHFSSTHTVKLRLGQNGMWPWCRKHRSQNEPA